MSADGRGGQQAAAPVTGSIPHGPVNRDTEIVFVAGQAFINAAKHEQAIGRVSERLRRLEADKGVRLTNEAMAVIAGLAAPGVDPNAIVADPKVWEEIRQAFPRHMFDALVASGTLDYELG